MSNIKNLDNLSNQDFTDEISNLNNSIKNRLNADPEGVQQGLAKLVLTLIELLRQLMEKQAMRRIENGTVNDAEIEKLGEAFMNLDIKMAELREVFNLTEEDLNLNLGPLGDLM
ncbi:MAG: gas vesicle protein GvpK [Clostridiales bacterium GWF2_38_85]|nr:MAG: gas vesicle protein GvpK [Clostridiales bacterium GWF2_38_85]